MPWVGYRLIGGIGSMSEIFADDLSKESQLARSPGRENRACPQTGITIRDCTCYSCRGRRNRTKGKKTQREVRKGLERAFGVQAGPMAKPTRWWF